jgi:hypothetical protein
MKGSTAMDCGQTRSAGLAKKSAENGMSCGDGFEEK